jgi:SAM-dependent methyltransferase
MIFSENRNCNLCGTPTSEAACLFPLNAQQRLLRCRRCGLTFNSHFRTDLAEVYSESYFQATEKSEAGGYYNYPELEAGLKRDYRFAYRFIVEQVNGGAQPLRLLDIGCGYGFFLKQFLGHPGVELTGIEINPSAAEFARKSLPRILQGSVAEIELQEEFDCVVAFEVVEHLFDPRALLETVHARLRAGGHFLLTTPIIGSRWFTVLGRRWPAIHPAAHNYYFNPGTFRALAESCGFRLVSLRRRQVLHKKWAHLRQRLGSLFRVLRPILGATKFMDNRLLPFLSGGSMELILQK